MINGKDNPVEWALLSYEIEEAIEHLQDISDKIIPGSGIDEEDFKIRMGHVYAHLNRIWHSRNHIGDISSEQSEEYSEFPKDVKRYG